MDLPRKHENTKGIVLHAFRAFVLSWLYVFMRPALDMRSVPNDLSTSGRIASRACASVSLMCAVGAAVQTPASGATNVTAGCIERFDPAADYFRDKAVVEDAAGFRVEYRKSYKVITIKEAYPGGPSERYVAATHTESSGADSRRWRRFYVEGER
jgi:hypothetical protein